MINAMAEGLAKSGKSGDAAASSEGDWMIQSVESLLRQALPTLIIVGRQRATYFNEACRRLVLPVSAAQGGRLSDIAPSLSSQLVDTLDAAWTGAPAESDDLQLHVDRPEGAVETWVTAAATPIGRDGQVQAVLCVFRDVTEQRHLKRRLAAAESTLDALSRLAPLFLWRLDTRGAIRWMNERCQTYLGVGLAAAREDGWIGWLHPSERDRVVDDWGRAVTLAKPFESRHRLKGVDGVYRWFIIRALPQLGADGELSEWHATAVEIVDLEPTAPQYRLVWCADAGDRSRQVFGAGGSLDWPDEWREAIAWGDQLTAVSTEHRAIYTEAVTGLSDGRPYDIRYVARNAEGRLFEVEETGFPVVDTEGRISQFIGETRVHRRASDCILLIDPSRRGCALRGEIETRGLDVTVVSEALRRPRLAREVHLAIYCSNSTVPDILGVAETVRLEHPGLPLIVIGDPVAPPRDLLLLHQAGVVDLLSYDLPDDAKADSALYHAKLPHQIKCFDLPSSSTKHDLTRLSPRELEILELAVEGGTSKTIGRALGISPRTVDYHRGKALDKLGLKAVSQASDLFTPASVRLQRRY